MPDSSPLVGRTISHYRIIEKIGAGGMGEVYRAHDEQLDRDVALKILPAGLLADEAARKQFRKEALALAKLNHPNIETVYEFGSQDGIDFLAMELMPGDSLRERIKTGPLAEREIVRLGMQLAEGLAAAHDQGIIHRDLKPGNLFVTPDGRLKILDFGLARLIHPELANDVTRSISIESGTISGTVPYMPPEQLRGEPTDARSDIYSAGAVLYEMAAGRRPFPQTQGPELMGAILHKAPPPPAASGASTSAALESVILKALEKEASQRYRSARELRVALEGISSIASVSAAAAVSSAAPSAAPVAARRSRSAWIVGAAAVAACLAVGAYVYFHRVPKLTDKDTIVLAEFGNSTSDPVFDDSLRQGLSVQLEQSPFLRIVSEKDIEETLKMMNQKPDTKLTGGVARELCQRVGSVAVLEGSIAQIGAQYLLTLRANNCESGESLASSDARASDKNHVLDALGKVAAEMRVKLGESLRTVRQFDTPLEEATTSSLEALKAYSLADKVWREQGDAAAIPIYQHAIELDPNFAVAYETLAGAYANLGQEQLAIENAAKAYELRDRVSEAERDQIIASYYDIVLGDEIKAAEAYELLAKAYPRDDDARMVLGDEQMRLGQWEKALVNTQQTLSLNSNDAAAFANLAQTYMALNRVDDAKAAFEQAHKNDLDGTALRLMSYYVGFLQGDSAEQRREVDWATGKPQAEDVLFSAQSDTESYFGRIRAARDLSHRAVESAQLAGAKETAAVWRVDDALREAEMGYSDEAKRQASLVLSTGLGSVEELAALALARAGDVARAGAIAEKWRKHSPEDTSLNYYWLPATEATIDLRRKEPAKAVERLESASPYELGYSAPFQFGTMYPVYVRGEAYLALHQGAQAAAAFQRILDHRGIILNFPFGALAHLRLGQAYVLQGDTAKARAAYNDFFTLWKDADPDIPILKEAKAEYAKLQ